MTTLKQKPNGIYYLDTEVPVPGGGLRRARIGLDTRDQEEAERQRRDWIAGVHPKCPAMGGEVAPKGRLPRPNSSASPIVDTPLVSSWLASCLSDDEVWGKARADITHRSNVKRLSMLLPSDLQIGQLSSQHMVDLVQEMRSQGYAEGSIRKLAGNVMTAARRAVDVGLLRMVPKMPKVDRSAPRERVLTLDEEVALLDYIRARSASEPGKNWWWFEQLVILLLDTGMRLGEALQAGPSWVKRKRLITPDGNVVEGVWLGIPQWATDDKGVKRKATKSGKGRDIPLTARATAVVAAMNERMEGTKWFPWKQRSGSPITMLATIRGDMAQRGFDLTDVVLHTMRHTCATRLAENGFDLVGLRDFLGHSDIKITAGTYLHLMNGHVFRAATILDAVGGFKGENREVQSPYLTKPEYLADHTERAEPGTVGVH